MDATFLLKGMVIGFSIAAPVGPIGVLCIRRSLANGASVGFVSGLGAATADAAYGSVAGFGLTAISSFLVRQQFWLGLIGGIFLCYLGVRTFLAKPAEQAAQAQSHNLLTAYTSTLFLTVTNPATILSFVAVFAGFGLGAASSYPDAAALVSGVFLGSAMWWFLLSGGVSLLRSRMTPHWLRAVNRLSGAILFVFGCYALIRIG
jgi:threonine/homoserine/homoserine lactone efflux protein